MNINNQIGRCLRAALLVGVCLQGSHAWAVVPARIDYQGFLTTSGGAPVDAASIEVTFALYDVSTGGAPLWSETRVIAVAAGIFSVDLGRDEALPATLFDSPLWIGITIAGDSEMTPRRAVTSGAFAIRAALAEDARQLGGRPPAAYDQSAHVADTANPHAVTLEQLGGIGSAALQAHAAAAAAHHARYTDAEAKAAVLSADGAGSGLDADRLDGFDSSAFARSVSGMTTIVGNDNNGTTAALQVTSNTQTMLIDGNEIDATNSGSNRLFLNFNSKGPVQVPVLEIAGGADIAEPFHVMGPSGVEPGMVVSIDPTRPGALRLSSEAYDRKVAGIVSGAGGINPGMTLSQSGTAADGELPVALTGRVYCYVDAHANGPIQPGDMLTTSTTPGHAMRVDDYARGHGAILGKAMTGLANGRGLVLVLVSLQ